MKKHNVYRLIEILLLTIIIVLIIILVLVVNFRFELLGKRVINIDYNKVYVDEGYKASFFGKNVEAHVRVNSNLNNSKVGTYYITYELSFIKLVRTINVVDNNKPVLNLNGSEVVSLYTYEAYEEDGVTAYDDYDKEITHSVQTSSNLDITTPGDYHITYSVEDSSGNVNTKVREVKVKSKISFIPTNSSERILNYIESSKYDVSVGYYNLVTGQEFYYQPDKLYYGASLIKTLDAIYLYDNNLITDELQKQVEKAISVSDNAAHAYLLNYIGKNNLKQYGIKIGAKNTLIGSDDFGSTTVKDQIVYLKKLYELSKEHDDLKEPFINSYGNYLQFNDLNIMHKYGYYNNQYHDVGIVLDDNDPYILVILTNEGNNNPRKIINDLSILVYDFHNFF